MKTNYIYVAAVALALMATGCSDDQLVQTPESAPQGHQVRVSASLAADSRLTATDKGERLEFTWDKNDKFYVYDPTNQQSTEFTKEADTLSTASPYATFVGSPEKAYQDGKPLYAVYNRQVDYLQFDEYGNVTLDISRQTGKLDENFQFMFAETDYSTGKEPAFPFRHLVTMVKLNISVPAEVQQLKEIYFKCNNLPTRATLVLGEAPYDSNGLFEPGDLVSCYNLDYYGTDYLKVVGDFVPVDGIVTAYLYVLPVKSYHANYDWYNEPSISPFVWMVDDNASQYVGKSLFDSKNIVAGKTYQLNSEAVKLEPFANEKTATGTADSPYEIATAEQLYSFMFRTSNSMRNVNNYPYHQCHYLLTSDIQLNNEYLWKPTTLNSGSFDGQGHTISGNVQMHVDYRTGLFDNINNSTVQNLTLDLNPTFNNDYNREWFGTLAGYIYDSKIINCVNRSNVSGKFYRMGGLVGESNGQSSFVACVNTGTLTAQQSNRQMGGIIACMYGNETVEACYNTGEFNVNTVYYEGLEVGGIVGRMNYENQLVQSCWSNSTLTIENVIYDDTYVNQTNNIFMGGIVGYQQNGSIQYCYWNDAVEFVTAFEGGSIVGGGTFADDVPTAEQLTLMNGAMNNNNWFFQPDGSLKMNDMTQLPSWGKENFGNN